MVAPIITLQKYYIVCGWRPRDTRLFVTVNRFAFQNSLLPSYKQLRHQNFGIPSLGIRRIHGSNPLPFFTLTASEIQHQYTFSKFIAIWKDHKGLEPWENLARRNQLQSLQL